jgi:crossover junction endodeoxyribonuclease RusA
VLGVTVAEFSFVAPTQPLTVNQRQHFHQRAKATKVWREGVRDLALTHGLPRFQRALIRFTVQHTTNHHRDTANWYLTAKACVDGLVDAGVLPAGDCDCYVVGPDMRRGPKLTAGPGPVVTIRLKEISDTLPESGDNRTLSS